MLLSRSTGASATCLRCQLRQVILQSPRAHQVRCLERSGIDRPRCFTASRPHREHDDETIVQAKGKRPYKYHYPLGRIVGEPGKRQRQGTQQLKIDTMGNNVEVILMRDVQERTEERKLPVAPSDVPAVSAAQISQSVANESQDASMEEVIESIDALRPDTKALDAEHHESLLQSLKNGYNALQLSHYLSVALNLSAVQGDKVHIIPEELADANRRHQRSQWHPGRTPLEKRQPIGSVVHKSETRNRPKLAEQILRLAWNLTIQTEEQKVGELEIRLKPWELSYFFALRETEKSNQPMYKQCIASPLLLRSSDVRPYYPHSIMRITARRQDAEEIASRL